VARVPCAVMKKAVEKGSKEIGGETGEKAGVGRGELKIVRGIEERLWRWELAGERA